MSESKGDFSSIGFAKTFVLPGLLVFLVPVCSLFFFLHAQNWFNEEAREVVVSQIRGDETLSPEDRERAIAHFIEHPFSELIQDKEFAQNIDSTARLHYATFRWMIRLSIFSITASVVVFLLGALCVLLSVRSPRVQYFSLSTGWQVLRIFGAVQVIIQGILLVALSFWVTALWFNVYIVKLILIVGILAVVGIAAVIAAIFRRVDVPSNVEGEVIDNTAAMPLWHDLKAICDKVGTAPPDQIIVGIDDNFFVTEQPITVDGRTLHGRTLYVSLALLKHLNGAEADSVLAHEMAHFSGDDTLYSKKIAPLLRRYQAYLEALYNSAITRPIFYFMNCFRALFELSLGKLSRQREFRADRVAVETTSPRDFSGAMLRIAAYSKFREEVQRGLFEQERVLQAANISQQIGEGYRGFATKFASEHDTKELATTHPFDSHPPMIERLNAVGVQLTPQFAEEILASSADGRWFHKIDNAPDIERQQWEEFENRFRQFHEETLAYRFIPDTEEERAIVAAAFPDVAFEGKRGTLSLNFESMQYSTWPVLVAYRDIVNFTLDDHGTLEIAYGPGGKQKLKMYVKDFGSRQQEALDAINRYYSRYLHAIAYQEQKDLAAYGESGDQ